MNHIEAMKQALEALESSRVFVTSRERIKHPEGTEWYDKRITTLHQAIEHADDAVAAEREACAKLIENGIDLSGLAGDQPMQLFCAKLLKGCADLIRARGKE
jgi:L-lysine 2,3-aminomutase